MTPRWSGPDAPESEAADPRSPVVDVEQMRARAERAEAERDQLQARLDAGEAEARLTIRQRHAGEFSKGAACASGNILRALGLLVEAS